MDKHSSITDIAVSAPPVVVTAYTLLGYTLENWVAILTIIWVSLQILNFIYQEIKDTHWFIKFKRWLLN